MMNVTGTDETTKPSDPAGRLQALVSGLCIEYLGGHCPVQAEGTINGRPFYFRSRGDGWSFGVGDDAVGAAMGEGGWRSAGKYGEWPDAGWMPKEEALEII